MKKVLLLSTETGPIAESLVQLLNENGIKAELRLTEANAGIWGQTYNQVDILVPNDKIEEAKKLLEEFKS